MYFLEVGVHDILLAAAGIRVRRRTRVGVGARAVSASGLRLVSIHLLCHRTGRFGEGIELGRDVLLVFTLNGSFEVGGGGFHLLLFFVSDLVAGLAHHLAGGMDDAVGLVAQGHHFLELGVVLGMGLGVAHHLVDLVVGEPARRLDDDGLFLAGGLVLGGNVENAVGVDVEAHLDLRHAARRRWNVGEVEAAEGLVLRCLLALALQHVNGHRGLVVVGGGIHLLLLRRDGGVLLDQRVHDATERLDAEGEGRHVEQEHVFDVTRQHRRLDGCAHGDSFVWVHVAPRLLAKELAHLLLHQRHPGLAADEDHLVDVAHLEAGVVERRAAGGHGALHETLDQGFELGAGELDDEVLGPGLVGGDVGQVDLRLLAGGELDLGLLRRFLEALLGDGVARQVHLVLGHELLGQVVDDGEVEVLAAEEGVAVGGEHLELVLAIDLGDLDDRDVEGAAAQVEHGDLGVAALLVHAVGEGGGGGFVDDALDVEASDAASVLGGLALGVVEVGRHGDDGFGHVLAQEFLRGLLHLLQDFGGDLRRRELLVIAFDPGVAVGGFDDLVGHHVDVALHHVVLVATADEPLDGEQGVGRIGHRLPLGALADEDLVIGVGDDGGRGAVALGVLDDARFAAVEHGNARVGGAEVDADDLAHVGLRCPACSSFSGSLGSWVERAINQAVCGATRAPWPPARGLDARGARSGCSPFVLLAAPSRVPRLGSAPCSWPRDRRG